MKQGKAWGETEEIFNNGTISINVLRINAGGFCSEHHHRSKANLFHVLEGVLEISQWPADAADPDVTELKYGESTSIRPGTWHKFRALSPAVVLEVYAVTLAGQDIVRRTHGGMTK